jgi:hypothetical protein
MKAPKLGDAVDENSSPVGFATRRRVAVVYSQWILMSSTRLSTPKSVNAVILPSPSYAAKFAAKA